jgi:hypothetical protein
MGSPLGPIIAHIFMNEFENEHMAELTKLGVKHWLRYVDDTFVILKNKDCAEKVLEFLNEKGKEHKIEFTMEIEENNQINFLDVSVKRNDNLTFSTSTYHKPTFTGVYLNWNSLTARKYKINLIKCLLDRIWKVCSTEEQKHLEINEMKENLIANNYPINIIDNQINYFLKSKNNPSTPLPKDTTTTIKKCFLSLPYINENSEKLAAKMSKLVSENFLNTQLIVAFKPPSDLSKQFPFKDKVDQSTLVVYHIKCKNCNADYIGKTLRNINIRISDHKTKDTAISRHAEEQNHEFDFDNVKFIDKADNNRQLELKEMLHIRKHKPTLNTQENSELFTLIIRNVQKKNDITCDRQRYVKKKTILHTK